MKFVVDRSKWRCGSDSFNKVGKGMTSLLNSDGFMCCLGHCALQVGATASQIKNNGMPRNTDVVLPVLSKKHKVYNFIIDTRLSEAAAKINDDVSITTNERERKLRSLFSKFKHKLVFKGKVVK